MVVAISQYKIIFSMTCKLPPTVRVHQIAIFPLGMINAFLVQGPDGCLLIDSGLPNSEDKIRKTLDALNLRFEDIKLIIITHAHIAQFDNARIATRTVCNLGSHLSK